ncbi:MAG: hypothetical protein MN733_21625 [Nitrososphaera sp.]|nr:hypothetical protein [Nitrososphaera sp.]
MTLAVDSKQMLSPPKFIPLDKFQLSPISYVWDDWNPYSILGNVNAETEYTLMQVSDRACIAFAISCAEWVVFRLQAMLNDARALQFIEACWAFEMSEKYRCPPESNEMEWKGTVRAPVDLALMTILNTIYATEDESAHIEAAFSELIPLHVLPDQEPFRSWSEETLTRLTSFYPRVSGTSFNEPVPREAMDPRFQITLAETAGYVSAFLSQESLSSNPFLQERRAINASR